MKKFFRSMIVLVCIISGGLFSSNVSAQAPEGSILLDVERNGEAYYVNPLDGRKYYLGRPSDAFDVMRNFGLGISNVDFARFDADASLRTLLAGRIILEVEKNGEAHYVHPETHVRHFLGRPSDAFNVMSSQGLGATGETLASIPDGSATITIQNSVPFTPQAPFAQWEDERQQEGCEEASVLMAMKWVNGESLSFEEAREEIIRMSDWQEQEFGYFEDTSVHDTAVRLFNRWFDYQDVYVEEHISSQDILSALEEGHLVVVSTNGKKVNHTFYSPPGPDRHMIVVHGFDAASGDFLTHDPGTKYGENHLVSLDEMNYMLRDYPSGQLLPVMEERTAMIVVRK